MADDTKPKPKIIVEYRFNEGVLAYSLVTLILLIIWALTKTDFKNLLSWFFIVYAFEVWGFQRTVCIYKKQIPGE